MTPDDAVEKSSSLTPLKSEMRMTVLLGLGSSSNPPGGLMPPSPLGTRALHLSAPGILIHGTPADYSIGTYASHGCIRMHMWQSEELFNLVSVGTTVFIIGAPPWGITQNPGAAG